jgi:hypothetical protein
MARVYGKLLCAAWGDTDFISLSAQAQRMYMLVVSQPTVSTCGVLDYVPARWARYAPGMTAEDVETLIDELEARRYVHVDRDYSELLIRSFVKNDGVCAKWPMLKSMWSAFDAIASPMLRELLVDALPDEAWDRAEAPPPPLAVQLRVRRRVQPVEEPPATTTATTPAMAPAGIDAARRALGVAS